MELQFKRPQDWLKIIQHHQMSDFEFISKADYLVYTSPVKSTRQRDIERLAQQKILIYSNDTCRFVVSELDCFIFSITKRDGTRKYAKIPARPGLYNVDQWLKEPTCFCCFY